MYLCKQTISTVFIAFFFQVKNVYHDFFSSLSRPGFCRGLLPRRQVPMRRRPRLLPRLQHQGRQERRQAAQQRHHQRLYHAHIQVGHKNWYKIILIAFIKFIWRMRALIVVHIRNFLYSYQVSLSSCIQTASEARRPIRQTDFNKRQPTRHLGHRTCQQ